MRVWKWWLRKPANRRRGSLLAGRHRIPEDTGQWRTPDDVAFFKKNKKLYNIFLRMLYETSKL